MPTGLEIWISKITSIAIDGDGIRMKAQSGERTLTIRMTRACLRGAVESGRRVLDNAEVEQRERVAELKRLRDGH